MIQIGNTIVSFDLFEEKFVCDTNSCKGACCVQGDSGAPLEDSEVDILEEIFPIVQKYMQDVGIRAIEKQGKSVIDSDGDKVTPLITGKECAYTYFEKGIAKCSIEKAYFNKEISFRKPISCHLYPIRINKYSKFEAVNYHKWDICKCAKIKGESENVPLYTFLKAPLERKYGKDWYTDLEKANNLINKKHNNE